MNLKICLLNSIEINDLIDNQNGCIFLCKKYLNKFKTFSLKETWFEIHLILNTLTLSKRKTQICILEKENLDEDYVYIPCLMWFNLTNKLFLTIEEKKNIILFLNEKENIESPKILNECYFTLIRSPNYPGASNYNLLFSTYFNKIKYLELNDVIAASTESLPEIYNDILFKSNVKLNTIYFKLTHTQEENNGLIDKKKTQIYLIGKKNYFIPYSLYLNQHSFYHEIYQNIDNNIYLNNYYKKLEKIAYSYLKIKTILNIILINGEYGCGKKFLIYQLAKNFNLNVVKLDAEEFITDSLTTSEIKIKNKFSLILTYSPCILIIFNIDILFSSFSENEIRIYQCIESCLKDKIEKEYPFLIFATSNKKDINFIKESEFSKLFTHYFTISTLNEDERKEIINYLIKKYSIDLKDNFLLDLYKETNGFNLKNINNLFIRSNLYNENGFNIKQEDLKLNLDYMKKNIKIQDKMPLIPNIKWDDVGGLLKAKKEIINTIQFPLKYSKYFKFKINRSGILFFGPPGTGKTLLAKAIANECNLNFLSVNGPEIMNMYIGQSEQNIRNLFASAKKIAPAIIFFDELDSIAPIRGKSDSSSGLMNRLVSTLLTEIDNMNDKIDNSNKFKQVFIIGATNRPDLLDTALLRPGRFDRLVYIDLPKKSKHRLQILEALTRKFKLSDDLNLNEIEKKCPPFLTGADFYSLCSSAMSNSIKRIINQIELNKINLDESNLEIHLSNLDFENALKFLKSSIPETDLKRYEYLKMKFNSKK